MGTDCLFFCSSLDTWIKEMEESLVRAEAVRGVPAEVEKQLEQLEVGHTHTHTHTHTHNHAIQ